MSGYFLLGGLVGVIFGYAVFAVLSLSGTSEENDNLSAYCDSLEETIDKLNAEIEQLRNKY